MAWWISKVNDKLVYLTPKCGSSSLRSMLTGTQIKCPKKFVREDEKVAVWVRHPFHRFMSAYNSEVTRNNLLGSIKMKRKSSLPYFSTTLDRPRIHNHVAPNVDYINWRIFNPGKHTNYEIDVGADSLRLEPDQIFRFEDYENEVIRMYEWLGKKPPKDIPHQLPGTNGRDIYKQLEPYPEIYDKLLKTYSKDMAFFGYKEGE